MITIIMGAPGVGKSTFLALMARKHLKKGIQCFSNYHIDGCKKLNVQYDLGNVLIENGCMLIDESGREHNARNYHSFSREQYDFYTQHRHYKIDHVYLAVQFWDRVDITIRELVQEIYILEPCILKKHFLKLRVVKVKIGIPEEEYEIKEMFYYKSVFAGGLKYYRKKPAFSMFDSWTRDLSLQEKEWELRSEWKRKEPLLKRIKGWSGKSDRNN
jgi:hypothetical protein